MADPSFTENITSLEDQTWQVLSTSGQALLPFLSTDCVMLMPFGMKLSATTDPSIQDVMTSDAFVPWSSYRMSDVIVTPIGTEGAVITYRVEALRRGEKGEDDEFRALISSTWRRDPVTTAWQMCVHQQTPFDLLPEDLS